jgi:hypothetical protein
LRPHRNRRLQVDKICFAGCCEPSGSQEIRPYRDIKDTGICQKRIGVLPLSNSLERFLTLRSKSVQVASMDGYNTAAKLGVANREVLDPIAIEMAGG